jgi:hypothetical protein
VSFVFEARKEQTLEASQIVLPLTDIAHRQVSQYLQIPAQYYDKVKTANSELLAHNVRFWLNKSSDRRMIRSLDGNMRAWLSNSYRRLDNYDLVQMILPVINELDLTIESCEVTDKRLYIKAVNYKLQGEVVKGDVVCSGVIIQNSEVGFGALSVKPFIYRLVCLNGAVIDDLAMRKYHAGREQNADGFEYSNSVHMVEDRLLWMKIKELIHGCLTEAVFFKTLETMKQSTEMKLELPEKSLELVTKKMGLFEGERADVLKHLIQGGDLSSWGMGNAITRAAHDVDSYDRATELEGIGYQVMKMNWN